MRIKSFSLSFGAQFFKALSDESRLRILNLLLYGGEMCISDIEMVLDFTQTKSSRHLIYLKNAALVNLKKVDQYAIYYIKSEVVDFLENNLRYLRSDSVLTKDLETFNTMSSNRELAIARIKLKGLLK